MRDEEKGRGRDAEGLNETHEAQRKISVSLGDPDVLSNANEQQ